MATARFLLFFVFLGGLFNVFLYATKDPGGRDPLVLAVLENDMGFERLAMGGEHVCGVDDAGGVWCWGNGQAGQLGHGRFSDSATPVPVVGLPGRAVDLALGGSTSCAVLEAGGLWCWGSSASGQIGLPNTVPATATPRRIAGLLPVHAAAVGISYACAAERTGGLACWGDLRVEREGRIFLMEKREPVRVPDAPFLLRLASGDTHTCGDDANGELWCWGGSDSGAIGAANGKNVKAHVRPSPMGAGPVRAFATGPAHTCALETKGDLKCWGRTEAFAPPGAPVQPDEPGEATIVAFAPTSTNVLAGWDAACLTGNNAPVLCVGKGEEGPWSPFGPQVPALSHTVARGKDTCGLDAFGGAWCAPLTPATDTSTVTHIRPSDWKADNSLGGRWHRVVGYWAGLGIASSATP